MLGRPWSQPRRQFPETHGPRPCSRGLAGRSAGLRRFGAPGQRLALRCRPTDPARSGLAEDVVQNALVTIWRKLPAAAGARALRGLGLPDPRERLLRGSAARPAVGDRPCARYPIDRAGGKDEIGRVSDRDELERAFRGCHSSSGPSSSCITTPGCRSWRWRRRSGFPMAPAARDCTTPPERFGPPSRRAGRRSSGPGRAARHERRPRF